jgi:hypothetical protein
VASPGAGRDIGGGVIGSGQGLLDGCVQRTQMTEVAHVAQIDQPPGSQLAAGGCEHLKQIFR